jgi:magnesium chelatase family protein
MGTNCKRATRPCPCGYLGHHAGACRCGEAAIARYRRRISGPLLDRIDLHVEVPALSADDMAAASAGECSSAVRERVGEARARQLRRQGCVNAVLAGAQIESHARPDSSARALLREAAAHRMLSARAHHRVLKVARTVADLEASGHVGEAHVAEALSYRGERAPRNREGEAARPS